MPVFAKCLYFNSDADFAAESAALISIWSSAAAAAAAAAGAAAAVAAAAAAAAAASASKTQDFGGVRGGSGSSMRRQGSSRRVKGVSKRSADVVAWAAKRQEQQQVGAVLRVQRALQMDERRQENGLSFLRNFI